MHKPNVFALNFTLSQFLKFCYVDFGLSTFSLSIHLDEYHSWFHFLTIVNNDVIHMDVYVSLCHADSKFLRYIQKNCEWYSSII